MDSKLTEEWKGDNAVKEELAGYAQSLGKHSGNLY